MGYHCHVVQLDSSSLRLLEVYQTLCTPGKGSTYRLLNYTQSLGGSFSKVKNLE